MMQLNCRKHSAYSILFHMVGCSEVLAEVGRHWYEYFTGETIGFHLGG